MVVNMFQSGLRKIFGSRNERVVKTFSRRADEINAHEDEVRRLTDPELKAKTEEFKQRRRDGESMKQMMPEVLAVAREAMDRSVGIRNIFNPEFNFDKTQLPGSLHAVYDNLKKEADEKAPIEVLGQEPGVLVPGWMQIDIPVEIYDAVRELYPQSRPPFRARPFDVQLIGGMVLGEGSIVEMKTGEGKTIVAPLACYVACIDDLQCHVVTTNDYLVQRDRDWVFPFYYRMGLTVGAIHPYHMQPPQLKAIAYTCNVVYGTNSEFGFDYLRDNMKTSVQEQVQKHRDFIIFDEVDSILIDEARTPLIISGPAHQDAPRYGLADQIAKHLVQKQRQWDEANNKVEQAELKIKGLEGDIRNSRDKSKIADMKAEMKTINGTLPELYDARDEHTQYYETEPEKKAAHLTHEGVAEAQKIAGIGSFYVGNNMDFPHLLENAVRGHVIYKRDKDYVVENGEVIIVDENTGRKMVGRQWSDGLHQAIETKENVKIKEETQTLATVTIQNFAKLYKRLGGMTGTAITEATEFSEIYNLDVVSIPTNKPVIRVDREDLIFLSEKDKWTAIVDEIERVHSWGRPVLVGTTSVERSELVSRMLSKQHNIKHEVLNAKLDQAEREGLMVAHAGQLGAVMIATNMAGRGTDIKLQDVPREALVRHWQTRDLLPSQANAEMDDKELIRLSYRHQAIQQLKLNKKDAESMDDKELRLMLFRHWVAEDAWLGPKAEKLTLEQCVAELDQLPDYRRHRLKVFKNVEEMGGLYVLGTERHESRRIDNQLRGRSGRQGDDGSSRFFISLEDDLMKMFAGQATMTALSKLGMKEGDAIEHKWVTRSVERAQRKVEERNYEIRKNLLEYDEVMEHQRSEFYGLRQRILEGKQVSQLIFGYIEDAVVDAVGQYLAPDYVATQIADWCRGSLDISVDPARIQQQIEEPDMLQQTIVKNGKEEVAAAVEVTLGEYMSDDINPDDWDLKGLQSWAKSQFDVDLKLNMLRNSNVAEVQAELIEEGQKKYDSLDMAGLARFLEPHYGQKELCEWAKNKFDAELDPQTFVDSQTDGPIEIEDAIDKTYDAAVDMYRQREVVYPVNYAMEIVAKIAQEDQNAAAEQLLGWANSRYELDWKPEQILNKTLQEVYVDLQKEAEAWLKPAEGESADKLRKQTDGKVAELGHDDEALSKWFTERFGGATLDEDELNETREVAATNPEAVSVNDYVYTKAREAMRAELTMLERTVLIQILDQSWKDHLYGMDQLRSSINLRGYAEKDPRIEYKREGANNFTEMLKTIRDRVTDLIYRARLEPNVQVRNAYGDQQTASQASASAAAAGTVPASSGGNASSEPRESSGERQRPVSRRQRRAAASRERRSTRQTRK